MLRHPPTFAKRYLPSSFLHKRDVVEVENSEEPSPESMQSVHCIAANQGYATITNCCHRLQTTRSLPGADTSVTRSMAETETTSSQARSRQSAPAVRNSDARLRLHSFSYCAALLKKQPVVKFTFRYRVSIISMHVPFAGSNRRSIPPFH